MLHKAGKGHGRCFLLCFFLYMMLKEAKGWHVIALKSESTLRVGYKLEIFQLTLLPFLCKKYLLWA